MPPRVVCPAPTFDLATRLYSPVRCDEVSEAVECAAHCLFAEVMEQFEAPVGGHRIIRKLNIRRGGILRKTGVRDLFLVLEGCD